jgi:hypothetical protein
VLIFILNGNAFRGRFARVHAFCLAMLAAGGIFFLLGGQGAVASALGRESHLSGRTEIWGAVIPAASNPIVGDGFESFWNSEGADKARQTLVKEGFSPTVMAGLQEAHNGYIEIYLQLGWIGICLIALVIVTGYKRAFNAYRRDPELGSLFIAYVAAATVYGITEAGFRTMSPSLIFLLTVIVFATAVTSGFCGFENPMFWDVNGLEFEEQTALLMTPCRMIISERALPTTWPCVRITIGSATAYCQTFGHPDGLVSLIAAGNFPVAMQSRLDSIATRAARAWPDAVLRLWAGSQRTCWLEMC